MAISGTFKIAESSNTSLLKMAFDDIYTLLDLDYTIERSFDKTGRPSGKASISFIKVTIRAIKEKDTPFHKWIKEPDFKMNGEINIYDSAGLLSSTVQDVMGGDPLIDVTDDLAGLPSDIITGNMQEGMDQVSNYGTHDDIYDEMSHKDLVNYADTNGIKISSSDSDDAIREKIRIKKESENEYDSIQDDLKALNGQEISADQLKEIKEKHSVVNWPDNDVSNMTLTQLQEYVENNKLTAPDTSTMNDDQKLAAFQELVKKHKDFVDARALLNDKEKLKNNIHNSVENRYKSQEQHDKGTMEPIYKTADKMKAKTVSSAKTIVSGAAKRLTECSRTIEFENAYCVSLREHFTNNPDSKGTLDKSYPWTFEIGIKPQKVTVRGYQFGPLSIGEKTEFVLYQ